MTSLPSPIRPLTPGITTVPIITTVVDPPHTHCPPPLRPSLPWPAAVRDESGQPRPLDEKEPPSLGCLARPIPCRRPPSSKFLSRGCRGTSCRGSGTASSRCSPTLPAPPFREPLLQLVSPAWSWATDRRSPSACWATVRPVFCEGVKEESRLRQRRSSVNRVR